MKSLFRFPILILAVVFLASCDEEKKTPPPPKGVMSQAQLVAFLQDIHKLESSLLMSGIRQDSASELYKEMEKEIYLKHKLDTGKVNRTLRYYTQNLELLDSLYKVLGREPEKIDSISSKPLNR
jgi:hypothetical protein